MNKNEKVKQMRKMIIETRTKHFFIHLFAIQTMYSFHSNMVWYGSEVNAQVFSIFIIYFYFIVIPRNKETLMSTAKFEQFQPF